MEIWVDVNGFEGFYQVSDHGNVRSLDRIIVSKNGKSRFYQGKLLKPKVDKDGYLKVQLSKRTKGVRITPFIHRLVAEAFLENPNEKPAVNHKNGVKSDNHLSNLEWVTNKENTHHAIREGLYDVEYFRWELTRRANEKKKKSVAQLKDGKIISVFGSISAAFAALGTKGKSPSPIGECCNGKRKSAFGYQWKFYKEVG